MLDVLAMARLAEAADGVSSLDEATTLAIRNHPEMARIWGDVRGFGLLIGEELTLLVMPHERGTGLGRRLLLQAPEEARRAWSHGDHPAARALAASHGWTAARELWVMRRGASVPLPAARMPAGVSIRSFRPGDEEELLRVNTAAFADHPEQGRLDVAGLRERMAEPWFSAAGLVTAWDESSGRMLGFHWTKQHDARHGEVYVVAVDPAAQGRGVGRLVTAAGLEHLISLGVSEIVLYVEADNVAALRLYEGIGFGHAASDTHVQYRRAGR